MEALRPFLDWLIAHTYVVVFVGSLLDATGLPFPGRLLLIAAGALAGTGHVSVTLVTALGALGVMVTDQVWYLAGALGSEHVLALFRRMSRISVRQTKRTAKDYVDRYGGATILIGRFFATVRVLVWPLAAACGVGYPRFVVLDLVAALIWSATWVLLGWFLGDQWQSAAARVGPWTATGGALALALLVVLAALVWRRRRRGSRAADRARRRAV